MGLVLEVERNGHKRTVDLDLVPTDEGDHALPLSDPETVAVVALVGHEVLGAFAEGHWDHEVADAILYVKLYGGIGDIAEDAPAWTDFTVDWSQVGLGPPDPEMESALAELSEVTGQ